MIIEYIERLRKKPVEVRKRAVFFWTIVLVALILLVYIAIVTARVVDDRDVPETRTIAAPYDLL